MSLRQAPCKNLSDEAKLKFFPPAHPSWAKKFCRSCPAKMRAECLELGMSIEDPQERFGVWGGLSSHQRAVRFGGRSAEAPE